MKNFLLTFATILASIASLHATNIGDGEISLIKNEILSFSLDNEGQRDMIISTVYNNNEKCITMEFESELVMIQLYNSNGELDLMFPVSSKKVNLGMSLFNAGTYTIGFMVDGKSKVEYAQISIN